MQSNLQTNVRVFQTSPGAFNARARLRSIGFALQGIRALIRDEPNARIHLAASLGVVLTGWLLHCARDEWRWLLLAMALVWIAEAFNTAIEVLCNFVQPDFHPQVKRIKDLAAGAVLLAAATAVLIGTSIVWPHLVGAGA